MSRAPPPGLSVVLVSTSFPSRSNPASGIFVARLARELSAQAAITVVAPAGTESAHAGDREYGVAVRRFRYAPRSWQLLAQRPGGIPVALREHPWLHLLVPGFLVAMGWAVARSATRGCVVHANWAVCGVVAGVVGRLRGCPVIVTLRGEDVTRARSSRVHRLVLACALRLSAQVVTVSEAFRDWLVEQHPGVAARTRCVPNGVEPFFVAVGEERTRVSPPASPLALVAVGSLIPRKGIDQLLEALARVRAQWRLTVVGDGPQLHSLRQQCTRLGLDERVRFAGAVSPGAIAQVLAAADAFVLPSHSEGRPNAVLEAMAAGLPVIATDIDGVRELVVDGETGLLFRDGAVDALAAVIATLVGDREQCRRLGAAGARRIRELGLLWEQTAHGYLALYRQLAGARG